MSGYESLMVIQIFLLMIQTATTIVAVTIIYRLSKILIYALLEMLKE